MSEGNVRLSVIMAEYGVVEKNNVQYPVVYLIGRDETGKKRILRQQIFPYFYITEKDYLLLKDSKWYADLNIIRAEGVTTRDLTKRAMVKLTTFTDYDKIVKAFKSLNKYNKVGSNKKLGLPQLDHRVYTYELDYLRKDMLPLRFLIDNGIKSGVEVDSKGNIVKPIDFIMPQRRWKLDFEAYTFKEYTSGINPNDPLNMISILDSYNNTMYTYYVRNPNWWKANINEAEIFKPFTEFPHIVKGFDTEPQFLDGIMELVKENDPDKFIAWNLMRYDAPKWKQRTDINVNKCLYKFASISPLKSVSNYGRINIKGRILFDLMIAYKKFTDAELASYSLAFITHEENLGVDKIPFKGTSGQCWDQYPEIVYQRNVKDALIMEALDQKYGVTETFEDKQTEWGTLPHEVLVANRVIDTALMRMVHNEVILRTVDTENLEDSPKGKLLGARVVEPKVGEYEWAFQFDFGAEYPSMIEGFNISPETYVKLENVKDFSKVHHIHYEDAKHGVMDFCFKKEPVGLIPRLIKHFKAKRKEYKVGQEKAIVEGQPEHIVKMWDRRQYNAKKNTNAIYGTMKYDRFRLKREECTQATAVLGRIAAECEYAYLPEADVGYGKGYTLLYGDTDSFFVLAHSRDKDSLLDEGKKLQQLLMKHLSEYFTEKYGIQSPTELGFKAIYSWIMFIGKKTYTAEYIWDEKKGWKVGLDIKGIASVRSDASRLEKASLETLIGMLPPSKGNSTEILETYVDKVLQEYDRREYDPMDLSYPAQIKKTLKRNNNGEWILPITSVLPAHYKSAIYSNMYLMTEFLTGDKPRRLPVLFPKLKTIEGQETLFKTTNFPTQFIYRGKIRKRDGSIISDIPYQVKDISIVEDMHIPSFFLSNVDYNRIRLRLAKKLYGVLAIHTGKDYTDKIDINKKRKKKVKGLLEF